MARFYRKASLLLGGCALALSLGAQQAVSQPAPDGADGAPPAADGAPPPAGAPPGGGPGGPGGPGGSTGLTLDQVTLQSGPASVGRAAPAPEAQGEYVGPTGIVLSARDGAVPEGIEPLERTIFNSDDFYADRDLWMDPRYYQCASPFALEDLWADGIGEDRAIVVLGDNFPETVAWGNCDTDFPREQIVSPYPFETAQEHYEALMAEAESRGGPTIHTTETLPDWSGVYSRVGFVGDAGPGAFETSSWVRGHINQVPTYLSLLTPEYQERMVQQMYHTANTNAPEWTGSYCWPEGFMRRWFDPAKWVMLTEDALINWNFISETLFTQVMFNRSFNLDGPVPVLTADTRRWFGETIGFWDGDVLITWTSNIQGWTAHGWFEWSDQMQSIEIYTPMTGPDGAFVGINHETILYDAEALVEPVRINDNWEWGRALNEGMPFEWRECIQTLFPIEGFVTPISPGTTIEFEVPDMFNRPWAQIWEEYFEQDMSRPEEVDVLSNF